MPAGRSPRSKHRATKPYILTTVLPSYGVTDLFDWSSQDSSNSSSTNSPRSTWSWHSTNTSGSEITQTSASSNTSKGTGIFAKSQKRKLKSNLTGVQPPSNVVDPSPPSQTPLFWPSRSATPARRGTSEVPLSLPAPSPSPVRSHNTSAQNQSLACPQSMPSIPIPTVPIYDDPDGPCSVPVRPPSTRPTPLRSSYRPTLASPIPFSSNATSFTPSTQSGQSSRSAESEMPETPSTPPIRSTLGKYKRRKTEDSNSGSTAHKDNFVNHSEGEGDGEGESNVFGDPKFGGVQFADGVAQMLGPNGEVDIESTDEESEEDEYEDETDELESEDETNVEHERSGGVYRFIDDAAQVARSKHTYKDQSFQSSSKTPCSSSYAPEDDAWTGAQSGPISFRRRPRNVAVLTPGTWSYSGDGVSRQPVNSREVGDIHFSPSFGGARFDYWVCVNNPTRRWARCMEGQAHPSLDGYVLKPRSGKLPPQWILAQSLRAGKSRERKRIDH